MNQYKKLEERIERLENKLKLTTSEEWVKIGGLEWLNRDLGDMDWNEAVKACKEVGGRLPTRTELINLYDNHHDEMEELIEEPSNIFWSVTETSATYAWYVFLTNGFTNTNTKTNTNQVRCVR